MIRVSSVTAEPDFYLRLTFSNKEQRRFDLNSYLKFPVYHPLQNLGFFGLARVAYGTVVWPGDIVIAPETLYDRSTLIDISPA